MDIDKAKLTPLMQQFWDVKSAHPDKILLFRMGDFYEMFYKDAEVAAPILGIALTSRNKKSPDETPMCGVPYHSIAGPINKLLAAGLRVAICDRIEDPKFAKGIVKRAVTRVLSPGLVYDPDTLDSLKPNYLASFDDEAISFLDTTTGEAFYYRAKTKEQRARLLDVLSPVEIVLSERDKDAFTKNDPEHASRYLISSYELKAAVDRTREPTSSARLRAYAVAMQGASTQNTLGEFECRELRERLEISPTVARHLELFETYKGEAQGSLFHAINRCRTSPGARLLKNWMSFPLGNRSAIEERLSQVAYWVNDAPRLRQLRETLSRMGDVQRRVGKIANPNCNPRDLKSLAESLDAGLEASALSGEQVWWQPSLIETANTVIQRCESVLVDDPPVNTKNGRIIRQGFDPGLDELIQLSTNSNQLLLELEAREREATGIPSLKIRYNNVFGYYIEITNTHKDRVPTGRYQRKQTLANAERFITPELQELESKVLTAETRRIEVELKIFDELKAFVLEKAAGLLELARQWAELDVISSLGWLAIEQQYARPTFTDEMDLCLKASRHPVIEQALSLPFVANTIELGAHHCLLLTGPNMAGKSTLMRQVAIASTMGQMGSFVPAEEARLPVFDRVFTRIGASDYLAEGLSTFMVEMKETSEMLKQATPRSLVILDEVGRGTSTFDGMSLAQAILEYLLEHSRAMTLFATHYHELTELEASFSQLKNAHMAIHEKNGEISFLHSLVPGAANKSYSIHVARLAGLPASVTRRAWTILRDVEDRHHIQSPQLSLLDPPRVAPEPPPWNDTDDSPITQASGSVLEQPHPVIEELKRTPVSELTPLQALNQIAKWQDALAQS